VAESPHSPGTTTQLSGVRSTTELIARRASRYAKSEKNLFIAILLPTSRGSVKRRNGKKELKPSEQLNNSSEKARKEKL
jgi:hypothetical protein